MGADDRFGTTDIKGAHGEALKSDLKILLWRLRFYAGQLSGTMIGKREESHVVDAVNAMLDAARELEGMHETAKKAEAAREADQPAQAVPENTREEGDERVGLRHSRPSMEGAPRATQGDAGATQHELSAVVNAATYLARFAPVGEVPWIHERRGQAIFRMFYQGQEVTVEVSATER